MLTNARETSGDQPDPLAPFVAVPRGFVLAAGLVALAYSPHLFALGGFALGSNLYSHIVLIPIVSVYLLWLRRKDLPQPKPGSRGAAAFVAFCGISLAALVLTPGAPLANVSELDRLSWLTTSFLLTETAVAVLFLGSHFLRAAAFPVCFLVFMIPMTEFMELGVETVLQHGSADVVQGLFELTGLPYVREGLVFHIPGIPLEVARECSGIHSSLVLFITSLVAGQLFLHSPWKRTILAVAVIPLALLRNGFRILVIAELCARMGPEMINSYIHKRGGPIFFGLSLIPFFLLLWLLRRSDRRAQETKAST